MTVNSDEALISSDMGAFKLVYFQSVLLYSSRTRSKNENEQGRNMSKNRAYLSLSQAAEETNKSKSVISKALKSGRISHSGKDENGYKIDPSELFRVFPKNDKNTQENDSKERSRTAENTQENAFKIKELEIRLEAEAKEKNFYKEQYEKIETDRDDWKKQAQTLLLQSPAGKSPQKPVEGNENISGTHVAENQKKLSSGQIWAITALFLIAILTASVGGYFYAEFKPQSPTENIDTTQATPDKPSETPVFIPKTPLNFSLPAKE